MAGMMPVEVMGLAMMRNETPALVLRESEGEQRSLVITVGAPEAQALLGAQQGVQSPRPSTIELLAEMINSLGRTVERVEVTELSEGIFISDLVLGGNGNGNGNGDIRVSARPSDAIALALRAQAPVSVDESVMDEAGMHIQLEQESEQSGDEEQEEQVERFRDFLDDISPEDFGTPPTGSA